MCGGPGASPTHPAMNPALTPVHQSSVTQQTVRDSGFIQ